MEPGSPHYHLARHSWMKRAKVLVRSRLVEPVRELLVGVQHRRLEFSLRADDCVRHVVAVRPRDGRSRAFNYARWLTRNEADAEDVVQDACLRAMRFFSSLRNEDARAWLFAIVRNTWYSRVSRRASVAETTPLDNSRDQRPDDALNPEERLLQQHAVSRVRAALDQLPADFRGRVPVQETACAMRLTGFSVVIISQWTDLRDNDRNIAWCREVYARLEPYLGRARYVNYLDHDEAGDPAAVAYGANYARLRELKAKYDPENVFHVNVNIRPR